MNVDDIVKLTLVLALCFAIVGISIQTIRLLGEFVVTIKEANSIVKNASVIVDKFTDDYDFISEQIKMIIETVSGFTGKVFVPLTKAFGFMDSFEKIFNRKKNKKAKEEKEEDSQE